jgi:hypothetical protein
VHSRVSGFSSGKVLKNRQQKVQKEIMESVRQEENAVKT